MTTTRILSLLSALRFRLIMFSFVILAGPIFGNYPLLHAAENVVVAENAANQAASQDKAGVDQVKSPSTAQTGEGKTEDTHYSAEAVVLVVLVLALLVALFFLLMWWSQRSDRLSYLGTLYQETIEDIEYKRLSAIPTERLKHGEYNREVEMDINWINQNPPPERPDELPYPSGGPAIGTRNPWGETGYNRRPGGYTTIDDDEHLDPSQKQNLVEIRKKWNKDRDNWEQKVDAEVQRRYQTDLDLTRAKAKEKASLAIDVDLLALRGQGPEFVLEFTTVVVIIFAAVILGILKILGTEQIGTLLAAIAGYVLGRATQRARNETARTPSPSESDKGKKGTLSGT